MNKARSEEIKNRISELVRFGAEINSNLLNYIQLDPESKKNTNEYLFFRNNYEIWYSESLSTIKELLPLRFNDFVKCYYNEKQPGATCIRDALIEKSKENPYLHRRTLIAAMNLIHNQIGILKSVLSSLESILLNIGGILQADLYDSELDAAGVLNKNGFHRAAGAMAGVVLEGHLKNVSLIHNLKLPKNPTLTPLNDLLKNESVIDQKDWRFIQRLGDIRNDCDHKNTTEPTKEHVDELIDGTDRVIKTIF